MNSIFHTNVNYLLYYFNLFWNIPRRVMWMTLEIGIGTPIINNVFYCRFLKHVLI